MPGGHNRKFTDDDFIRAAEAIEASGRLVTRNAIQLYLGNGSRNLSHRLNDLRKDPRWKSQWCHPSNSRPSVTHPWGHRKNATGHCGTD
jgi:hypothetical protein